MNTIQRLIFMVVLSGSAVLGQTGGPRPVSGEEAVNPTATMPEAPEAGTVLLANNGPAFNPASAATGGTLMLRSTVVKPVTRPVVSTRQRELFFGLMAAEHGAALVDAWSTRDVLRAGGRELDPLVRPFAHSPTLYAGLQVTPFAVDYLSARLMRSNHRVLRSMWWFPQLISTAGSVYCGVSNLGNRP